MELIFKIAWRNIWRHRGKSLIIGAILFLGAMIMTVGNGVISGMDRGLQKHIVNGFTGNIIVIPEDQESDNVFFGMMGKAIEPIYNYPEIRDVLAEQPMVKRFLPVGKNMAMLLNEDGGNPGHAYLLGVDFGKYREMFPDNMDLIEGRLMKERETGLLVATGARKEFYDYTSIWFIAEDDSVRTETLPDDVKENYSTMSIKDNAVFMGFSDDMSTYDIRLGVKGVIKYKALNRIWGNFVLVDIESYRKCLGYFAASDKTLVLSETQKDLLNKDDNDLDDLFGEEQFFSQERDLVAVSEAPVVDKKPVLSKESEVDLDEGAYNMVLVLVEDVPEPEEAAAQLTKVLTDAGVGARAISWRKATGVIGSMSVLIKLVLFIFILLLFVVAVIIIVNTLSMSALERSAEIGMMRAVGARKGFISMMFLGETMVLSFFFGSAGIAAGVILVNILTALNITTDHDMVQLLYGGDIFRPLLSIADVFLVVAQLAIVTILAVVYPVTVARGITPLDAISRE